MYRLWVQKFALRFALAMRVFFMSESKAVVVPVFSFRSIIARKYYKKVCVDQMLN